MSSRGDRVAMKTPPYQQKERYCLEWECAPDRMRGGHNITVRFPLGREMPGGYDHTVSVYIDDRALETFGVMAVVDRAVHEITREIKETCYRALCNDRLLFDIAWQHYRVSQARQEACEARQEADRLRDLTSRALRCLRLVAGEDDEDTDP